MVLKSKNQYRFQKRENIEGNKENILVIDCNKCQEVNKHNFNNESCIKCILQSFYLIRNKNFDYFSFNNQYHKIRSVKLNLLFDYFKHVDYILNKFLKIKELRKRRCEYKGFQCKIFKKDFFDFSTDLEYYINPIFVKNLVNIKLDYIKKELVYDSICFKCVESIESLLKSIWKVLNGLGIIKEYNKYINSINNSQNGSNFYEYYFRDLQLNIPHIASISSLNFRNDKKILEIYKIGEDNLFKVVIYKIPNEFERFYDIQICFESKSQQSYFLKIINDVEKNLDAITINKIISLEALINLYVNESIQFINSKYKFTKEKVRRVAFLAAIQKLNLQKIFPLLIDDYIEEIFLDAPDDKIYINHQKFGRCRTDIGLSLKEIERFKTFIRLYSGKSIDYSNPSIKLVLKNKFFYCRFVIDIEPINLNKFSLDIRKLNKNIFTIQDLLINKTLNPKMAAYLYFNILRRFNITATGETDTGKTTLINALDLLVPKEFRKIYVESVTESLNQTGIGRHQLKYKVDSLENSERQKYSKQNQIKKLLHRTPDIIYLGEILTKKEAEAMFHCLSAGLKGFQTIHSNDLDSLINRLIFHFKINPSCLKDLDLIILMKKVRNKRKIISISEMNYTKLSSQKIKHLFKYNPQNDEWDLLNELFNTKTIKKMRRIENLNEKTFYKYIEIYEDIFNVLSSHQKISLKELVDFFDEISFYSFISIMDLKKFWFSWKHSRGLNS